MTVTYGWLDSFHKRNPELTLWVSVPLSMARSRATDVDILSYYCDLLEETVVSNNLLEKPTFIFNMDATGLPLDPAPSKLIIKKGTAAHAVGSGDKS